MEAGKDDEIIEVLKSDHRAQFETGLLIGAIVGLAAMFLIYNLI